MSKNFEKISPEEQQRIISICLEEFAEKGYQQASTNSIVAKAQIPKGTLFYYFGSKKDMFLYLLDNAVRRYTGIYQELAVGAPQDLFESLLQSMQIRMQIAQKEPQLYRFFYKVLLDIPDELQDDLAGRFDAYFAASEGLLQEKLPISNLKEGIRLETVINMVHLLLEGVLNRYAPRFRQLSPEDGLSLVEEISAECRTYFELIKTGIYQSV